MTDTPEKPEYPDENENDTGAAESQRAAEDQFFASAGQPTATIQANSYRDYIADRTGELLESAVETAEKLQRPIVVDASDPRDGTSAPLVLRPGQEPAALNPATFDAYRQFPLRREGTSALTRIDSFIAVVERFKFDNSVIFARDDPARPSLTAVFDYHTDNFADKQTSMEPAQFGAHRASYTFPLSDEWSAWHTNDGKPMAMAEFASFLEDHIVDVLADEEPSGEQAKAFVKAVGGSFASPSKLMEIARNLQVNEAMTFKEARNLSSGESEIIFRAEHLNGNGEKLVMPNLFMIAIPVFARSTDYFRIIARLRYRKSGANLTFFYELWRTDLVFEKAFSEACALVAESTNVPLYFGAPEASQKPQSGCSI